MRTYQQQFITLCLELNVLRFGEFTLKSGRISPYFFNVGLFNTGQTLAKLGEFYAKTIIDANVSFDILFGPAYKGIPLVTSTVIALNNLFEKNVGYAFNRKETKDHGEGGKMIGSTLQGKRVLIIDDVITAGTAVGEAMEILQAQEAKPVGVIIALDRQERGKTERSAIQEIEAKYQISVFSIIQLKTLIDFIGTHPDYHRYKNMLDNYQKQYGCAV